MDYARSLLANTLSIKTHLTYKFAVKLVSTEAEEKAGQAVEP